MNDKLPKIEVESHEFNTEARVKPVMTGHRWRQKGIHVHCDSCEMPHGFTVRPNQLLTGINPDGSPVLSPLR